MSCPPDSRGGTLRAACEEARVTARREWPESLLCPEVVIARLSPRPADSSRDSRVTEGDEPAQIRVCVSWAPTVFHAQGCSLCGVARPGRLRSAVSGSQPTRPVRTGSVTERTELVSKAAFSLRRETRLLSQHSGLWPRHVTVTCWLSWRCFSECVQL